MKKNSLLLSIATLTLLAISLPSPAAAKDAVQAGIGEADPTPVAISYNGNPYPPGRLVFGTIQLFYEVDKVDLPGFTASFELYLGIEQGTTGQATAYPLDLTLKQTGSQNVSLSASPADFLVTS